MKRVIILQGVSGSGKTTYARKLCRDFKSDAATLIVSADHYFTDEMGRYRFNLSKIDQAHGQCFRQFIEAVQLGVVDLVIVDNTNTRVAEIAPYMLSATSYGYAAEIHRLVCQPDVAAARGVHRVPATTVVRMAGRIASEKIPPVWKLVVVSP